MKVPRCEHEEPQTISDVDSAMPGVAHDDPSAPASRFQFFQCCVCHCYEYAGRKAFNLHDLGLSLNCSRCGTQMLAGKYICACNQEWHKCLEHRHFPDLVRETRIKSAKRKQRGQAERQTSDWLFFSPKEVVVAAIACKRRRMQMSAY